MNPSNMKRLHRGCGSWTPKGWINADIRRLAGMNLVCEKESLFVEAVKE